MQTTLNNRIVTRIVNSGLSSRDQDDFCRLLTRLPNESIIKLYIRILESNNNEIEKIWEQIHSKILIVDYINKIKFLSQEQKNQLKKVIFTMSDKEIKTVLDLMANKKKVNKDIEDNINKALKIDNKLLLSELLNKTEEIVSGFVSKQRKIIDEKQLKEVRKSL